MRKVLLLVVVLLLSISSSAFAQQDTNHKSNENLTKEKNGWTDEKIDKRLKKLGFTEEQINSLNDLTKLEIAKTKGARKLLSFERNSHKLTEKSDGEFSTMGLEDDIWVNAATIDVGTKNGHPYVKIVADYDWSNMPVYRLQDGFAISFSDGWYADYWGFTEEQKKCSSYSSQGYCLSYYWDSTTIYNAHDETRLGGVGWKYDLLSSAYDARGTAYLYMIGNDESRIKSTSYSGVKAWYGHDRYNSNLGISVDVANSAGIAAGVSFGGEIYTEDSSSINNSELTW